RVRGKRRADLYANSRTDTRSDLRRTAARRAIRLGTSAGHMGRMVRMRLGSLAVIPATLLVSAAVPLSVVSAQALSRTVDEGTFLISRSGAPAGRESFRITRSGTGAGESYRATAQVALGDRRIVPMLTC